MSYEGPSNLNRQFKRSLSGGSTGSSSGTTSSKSTTSSRSSTTATSRRTNTTTTTTAVNKYKSSSGRNLQGHQFTGVSFTTLDHRRNYVTPNNNNPVARNMVLTQTLNLDNYRHVNKSTGTSSRTTTSLRATTSLSNSLSSSYTTKSRK